MLKFLQSYRESFFVFFFNLVDRLTFVILYFILARIVDFEKYGLIVSVFVFTNLLIAILDFGLPFYIQRECAINSNISSKVKTALQIRIISSIFLIIALILYSKNFNYEFGLISLIFLINFFYSLNQIMIFVLNGKGLFEFNFFSVLVTRLPLFVIWIIILSSAKNVFLLLISLVITIIFQFIYLSRKIELKIDDLLKDFSFVDSFDLLKKSIPFGLGVLFVYTYDKIDVLLIQHFRSNVEVAIYTAAYALYRNSPMVVGALIIPLYTKYSKAFNEMKKLDFTQFLQDFFVVLGIAIMMNVILILLSEKMIELFYGKKFIIAANVLISLSFVLPFLMLNNFTGIYLNSLKKERVVMWSVFVGMLINLVFNFLLIRYYGLRGAILATFLTEFSVFILQFIWIIILINKFKIKTDEM